MTCREKLKLDYSEWTEEQLEKHIYNDCPGDYGYDVEGCSAMAGNCTRCWSQHIPDEEPKEEKKLVYAHIPPFTEKFEKPEIKDSGNRREFASGAVRDMQEGKGRCDLMPLEVVAEWLKDDILGCIAEFKKQGTTTFLYDALNYFCVTAYPNMCTSKIKACLEVAKHFEEGAKKYGENNWQKGIPPKCYIDSAVRHYLKWLRGDKDEPHDRAFVWNLMCCIWEVDYHSKEEKANAMD